MHSATPTQTGAGGHPRALAYLTFTELCERFSYYGMTALLALYLVKQLLLPDHAPAVLGLAALRRLFEFRGAMSDQAFASLIYGWYAGLVYFTPILGGLLADRWLGVKRTVVVGVLLMSAGHVAMSFDATFLIALLLLIAGSGCLKGNIAAQVGTLYPAGAETFRDRGFTIFSTGINIGAVAGPLATGAVAALWGWHAGFALAAGLMLVALAVYLAGQPLYPATRTTRADRLNLPPLTPGERRRTRALAWLILLQVPVSIAYPMIWNIGILWVDQRVDLGVIPAAWFNSVDSFASIVVAAPLLALWAWQARRGREPHSIAKQAIGSLITAAAGLLFVAGTLAAGADGRVSVWWALAGYFGMGAGFMWYWPTLLALVSRAAPAKVRSTMMGVAYAAAFVGTVVMGWVGSFYGGMDPAVFWTMNAAIALAGGMLILMARRPLERMLAG